MSPLPLHKSEKLKAFAILSKHDSIAHDLLAEKMMLMITFAYTQAEAILGAQELLTKNGLNEKQYRTPYMMISREIDDVFEQPIQPIQLIPTIEQEVKDKKKKSADELASYVRYMFDTVGTPNQKKQAEAVITKFKETLSTT